MPSTTIVTILGAGALGAAMAARLGETNHEVQLWNRTPAKAQSVASDAAGVTAFTSVGEAVSGASVVITVLRDGAAVEQVMSEAIDELDHHAVWVQASTVGPSSARTLAELAQKHGIAYLDAPVSGSTAPARSGNLVWLVAGDDDALQRVGPVLRNLGSSVLHVGTGVEGSSLKLAINAWMTASTVAISDVLSLCDALAIDHESFVNSLEAGPLAMPYTLQKLRLMEDHSYRPGFAVELALKDLDLAGASRRLSPLFQTVRERLGQCIEAGHGHDDLAAVDYARGTIARFP